MDDQILDRILQLHSFLSLKPFQKRARPGFLQALQDVLTNHQLQVQNYQLNDCGYYGPTDWVVAQHLTTEESKRVAEHIGFSLPPRKKKTRSEPQALDHGNPEGAAPDTTTPNTSSPKTPYELHSHHQQTLPLSQQSFTEIRNTPLPDDRHLGRIYKNLREIGDRMKDQLQPGNPTRNGFKLDVTTGLLYMVRENAERLCIPAKAHRLILMAAHDHKGHPGVQKTQDRLRKTIYVPRLKALVESYVLACPVCRASKDD